MKLELPDNNASVLFHMGNALQSIARDIDSTLPVNGHKVTHTETMGDVSSTVTVEPAATMSKGVDSVNAGTDADDSDPVIEVSDTIDADGLPWDQRIHSRGKTRLADDTWRMARKPNDKTDEEWAEYVEGVKTELRALMAIPVATGVELDASTETPMITTEQSAEVVTPPVVDAPEVVTPPVVDAPEVVTPPVVDAPVTTGPTTFPELMKFITVNNKKLTKESVDEALKAQGLASIALLAARTDLIPQVHAALVKLL